MSNRTTAMIVAATLLAGALAVLALARPRKEESRIYRLGEQGLARDAAAEEELRLKVVASLKGYEITVGEIMDALGFLPQQQRLYYSTPEKVLTFVQNYALLLLLSRRGQEAGLGSRPYLRSLLEKELAKQYRSSFLADRVKASDISPEDIRRYLQSHPETGSRDIAPEAAQAAARAALLEERRQSAWRFHLQELVAQTEMTTP